MNSSFFKSILNVAAFMLLVAASYAQPANAAPQGVNFQTERKYPASTIQAEKRIWEPEQYASTQGTGTRQMNERFTRLDTLKKGVVDLAKYATTQGKH